jgi:rod shape-determining protein MreC
MPSKLKFFSYKLTKVLVVLVVFGLLVFFNPKNFFQPIRSAMFWFFSPIQKVVYNFSQEIASIKDFFLSIGELKTENEKLIKENQNLLSENASLNNIAKENDFLRHQMELLPRGKFNLAIANVTGQDPYALGNWIEIDKGERDGIAQDMPVIISNGIFIGKISEVGFSSSKVILISSPESAVNGMDLKTEAKGIAKGEYGLGIILDMILPSETVNVGDDIVTSGLGKNIPRGLFIGKVKAMQFSQDRLFQQAIVASSIDFSKLSQVFIIKEFKR